MKVLTFDELSPDQDRSRALVNLAAFGSVYDRARVEVYRRRLGCFSDYVGVFAVDGGKVLGQVFVLRLPYEFPDGPDVMSAIATVATRPDAGRRGIARRLLREAHRREREAGVRYASLWTNRSWGAHRLYEELGYRDIYATPWAVRSPTSRQVTKPPVRFATRTDLTAIERLHRQQARDRLGYRERPPGWLRVDVGLGYVDPTSELLVRYRNGKLAGYAHLDRSARRVICGEMVAISATVKRELAAGVGRTAGPLPWAFQHTLVTDDPQMFSGRAFVNGVGWYVMMGCDLSREWTAEEAAAGFGTRDPRFICLAGDRF